MPLALVSALLAVVLFREHLGRVGGLGVAGAVAAGVFLGGAEGRSGMLGASCVAAACVCWGLDNPPATDQRPLAGALSRVDTAVRSLEKYPPNAGFPPQDQGLRLAFSCHAGPNYANDGWVTVDKPGGHLRSCLCAAMHDRDEFACPSCGYTSPHTGHFCAHCGARLTTGCPVCDEPTRGSDRFCSACGAALGPLAPESLRRFPASYAPRHLVERILRSRAALEGERKQVSVLMVDLVGSMQLAQRFDPEEWHEILDRYFHLLADCVYRFDGVVNQFTGDGGLAFFGIPIAHEDHAQRACLAACALRQEVRAYAGELKREFGIEFDVRIGLNSGEVVIARVGDDLHIEYTAPGYSVGMAERMEKLANAGQILATRATVSLTEGLVDFRDLGLFSVKGVKEPLHVFVLERVRSSTAPLAAARERGLSRFIGREPELSRLETTLSQLAPGLGSIVDVVGDPGVGKSRLCYEFIERCRRDGVRVCSAHCLSHARSITFLPILALVRDLLGIDSAAPEEARRRVDAAVGELDERQRAFLPLLYDFVGASDPDLPNPAIDPDARQRQIASLIGLVIRKAAGEGPLVLLIDDLHWIDGASNELLGEIVRIVAGTRAMLVTTYRPEFQAAWREDEQVRRLALEPLTIDDSRALLAELLGPGLRGSELERRIADRTRGNPFFIEEVVLSLAESGFLAGSAGGYRLVRPVTEVEIPASLQAVIAARIDRLDEHLKRLLQTASVIGKRFPTSILAAVGEQTKERLVESLSTLADSGFLHRDDLTDTCAFHHPLIQEVAYRSQLSGRRSRLHANVAGAIQKNEPNRADENAALLAYHWECAGETMNAARWHARAAEWRSVDHAASSMQHWWKVRELVRGLPVSDETDELSLTSHVRILNLGWRLGLTEEQAESLYEVGTALATRRGDRRSLAVVANFYAATVEVGLGRSMDTLSPRTLERAREATRIASESDDPGLRLTVRVNQIYSRFLRGDLRSALNLAEQTMSTTPEDSGLAKQMFGFDPTIWIQSFRGQVLSYMGRPAEAVAPLTEALERAREEGETENQGWAEDFHTIQAWAMANGDVAMRHALRAVEIADTTGSTFSRIRAYKGLGLAHLLNYDWDGAVTAVDMAMSIGRGQRVNVFEEPSVLALAAEAHLGAGDTKAANECAGAALAAARSRHARLYECEVEIARAGVLLAQRGAGGHADVTGALDRAAQLIEWTGASSYSPRVLERRAQLARLEGSESARRRALDEALRLYTAMGATRAARRIEHEF